MSTIIFANSANKKYSLYNIFHLEKQIKTIEHSPELIQTYYFIFTSRIDGWIVDKTISGRVDEYLFRSMVQESKLYKSKWKNLYKKRNITMPLTSSFLRTKE